MVIVVETLSDRVCDMLRARIVSREISPGEAIRQDELAQHLGISKIPIREALSRLTEEGLVEAVRHKGFSATDLSPEEECEILALRARVEPEAIALAASNATAEERAGVRALAGAPAAGGPDSVHARLALRLALIAPCRQRLTTGVLTRLVRLAERYRGDGAEEDEQALIRAWLAGQAAAVRALVESQLNTRLQRATPIGQPA